MTEGEKNISKSVVLWLSVGVLMVFVQILLGGVTRLTGSGLSITRWDIVTGTIPPMNSMDWNEAFALYMATPQYQHINNGMSLEQFKYIFFWEYFHRLWARTMGFVFLIPFVFFIWKGVLRRLTLYRLGGVVLLASIAALFGWIMVASGLIERPWVNAYKLTVHLGLGISLFIFLTYTLLKERGITIVYVSKVWRKTITVFIVLAIIQVCFGGFLSGMKAALSYSTWPTMNGEWFPAILSDTSHWNSDTFLLYDKSAFMPALVQFIHRNIAYVLLLGSFLFAFRWVRIQPASIHWVGYSLVGIIVVQVVLGIITLLGSKGAIPVLYGVLHQGVGILLLTLLFIIHIKFKSRH